MERVWDAQADGSGVADLIPNHLANKQVEARFRRLSSQMQRIRRQSQNAQRKAGGRVQVPDISRPSAASFSARGQPKGLLPLAVGMARQGKPGHRGHAGPVL